MAERKPGLRRDIGVLSPKQLLSGYARGIFPMAASASDPRLLWFDPPRRGIMPLHQMRITRSLARRVRNCGWDVRLNHDFDATVAGCAERDETWINAPLSRLYRRLHEMGNAHSIELYEGDALVGGLFGVTLGGAFFGESMFSRRRDASKVAMVWLIHHLRKSGFRLFDTQYLTTHLASLGGREISRADYRVRLDFALTLPAVFGVRPLPPVQLVLQEMTQTS
ncbi:leucyl/phenylalanyl-tRNA--protein transferase [Paracoccus pacificus]|uniref:Leucyl/phenylalanyl-tRNA--protein transferase n=1 Tax=Paracoccus pacificus TaxID=1463598 RepID=A0ABW4RB72_9RHOB